MKHLSIALSEYATSELKGEKHNPEVVKYAQQNPAFKWITDDETAWCAIFVNWCLLKAGISGTNKANARSFQGYGTEVELKDAQPGDIVVFWRGEPQGWQGHVAFYVSHDKGNVYCLGGNQSNKVNISPYSRSKLLAVRKVPQSTNLLSINTKELTDMEAITMLLLGINHFKKHD
jgi:uncharacterized protein (TIGR02594 family)